MSLSVAPANEVSFGERREQADDLQIGNNPERHANEARKLTRLVKLAIPIREDYSTSRASPSRRTCKAKLVRGPTQGELKLPPGPDNGSTAQSRARPGSRVLRMEGGQKEEYRTAERRGEIWGGFLGARKDKGNYTCETSLASSAPTQGESPPCRRTDTLHRDVVEGPSHEQLRACKDKLVRSGPTQGECLTPLSQRSSEVKTQSRARPHKRIAQGYGQTLSWSQYLIAMSEG